VKEIKEAHEEAKTTLEDKKLKAEWKHYRIERIQNRLTQSLVVHLGVMMMEVNP
jgi:hypothetical protein